MRKLIAYLDEYGGVKVERSFGDSPFWLSGNDVLLAPSGRESGSVSGLRRSFALRDALYVMFSFEFSREGGSEVCPRGSRYRARFVVMYIILSLLLYRWEETLDWPRAWC